MITCDGDKQFCIANEKMSKLKCLYCKKKLKKWSKFLKKFNNNINIQNEVIDYKYKKLLKNKLINVSKLDDLKKLNLIM